MGVGGALEKHHAVNHRLQQSAFEKLEHGIKLRLAPHEGTQNRELPREQIADIELPLEAGCRATGDQPAAGFEAEYALLPSGLADVLEHDFAIPARWRETRSTNTYENAEFSAEILARENVSVIIVVTQRWHMKRAIWAFRRFGITALPAPCETER